MRVVAVAKRVTKSARAATTSIANPVQQESITSRPLAEIYGLYPGEWIAIRATAVDRDHNITQGVVLAHSPARADVSAARLRAHREDPAARTLAFHGGTTGTDAESWRESLSEAAELGALNAWW
jgi:hypothetical protein